VLAGRAVLSDLAGALHVLVPKLPDQIFTGFTPQK
jgi:hypothetical protein